MTSLEPRTQFRPSAALPGERSTSLGGTSPSLREVIRAVVHSVDEGTLRPVARPDAGLAFHPKTLLAVTIYCYTHDIYGSEDIEDALRRDGAFRALCHQEFPGALVLRRFRRENRMALHAALTAVLWFLETKKMEAGLPPVISEERLAEEATRRISKAMFIDSMGFEE